MKRYFYVFLMLINLTTARAEKIIYDNLQEILSGADVIILDAQGVFWDGKIFTRIQGN
ncbi:MAG: hypothetical protein LBI70_01605 [Rickettsiales bacterium]|jgi:hypothetical protein|nr:hypothetical protein [Rickettsiales bacterium]